MSGWPVPGGGIIGREAERRAVASFIEEVPSGGLHILTIAGDAGIGKSTLWSEGVARARELSQTVLAIRPGASEARMSFAGLADFLDPVIDTALPQLAPPQRLALEVALLRRAPDRRRPDERGVSVAFLSILRLLSAASPLLLAVDDLQWLDRPTARALEFALRRLGDEPVALLGSIRTGEHEPQAFALPMSVPAQRRTVVELGPMTLAELYHVVHGRTGAVFPRRILARVHDLSAGNPFFACELARTLTAQGQTPAPGERLPVPATVSELLLDRLAALPDAVHRALVVAAATARPTVGLVSAYDPSWDAGGLLSRAERAGLVHINGGQIRFAHPLLASAAYDLAPEPEREKVHRRLATIVDDPEQAARHLARASAVPDEAVAAALEGAALAVGARGAADAAAELNELAARATPAGARDAARRRMLQAAEHHFAAGDWERAYVLGKELTDAGASGPMLARALHVMAKARYYADSFPEARGLLTRALEHLGEEMGLRASIELDLVYVTQAVEGFPAAAALAEQTLAHAEQLADPGLLAEAQAVLVMARFLSGQDLDRPALERALRLEDRARRVPVNLRPTLIAGMIFSWLGEPERACRLLDELRQLLIERGEEAQLSSIAPASLIQAYCWAGKLQAAEAFAAETEEMAVAVGGDASHSMALCGRATVNAYLGKVELGRRQALEAVQGLERIGWRVATVFPLSAVGLIELSCDNPAAAHAAMGPMVAMMEGAGLGEPSSAPFLPDEIEALIGIGALEEAEVLLGTLEQRAGKLDRAISLAGAARCRGLMLSARGDLPGATASLGRALNEHLRAPRPVEEQRTRLVLGVIQRRSNHRREARESFEQALAGFEQLGCVQWAARARAELARLGLRRTAGDELTPTEEVVAQHAATGMTNRQIAAALFISPKTVEANLARVYRKLGINSRAELGRVMAERERSRR